MVVDVLERVSRQPLPPLHVVFWFLIASGCWVALSRARRPIIPWVAVVLCSVAWLRADQDREGRVLLSFSPAHGLTEADLLVPAVVFAAAASSGLLRTRRGRRDKVARHRQQG
jgi:hypothetical protein